MNITQKQIAKALRITGITVAFLILTVIMWGWHNYWKTELAFKGTVNTVFIQSVKDAIQLKKMYKPNVRQVTIAIPTNTTSNGSEIYVSQDYVLMMDRVNADTINSVFLQKLREITSGIHSFVTVDYAGNNSVSGDTLNYSVRHRTPVLQQDIFNEINYRGLICYSPMAIFKQMPKGGLYILSFITLVLLVLFFYLLSKRYRIQQNAIIHHRNGTWNIGYTLFDPAFGKLQREEKICCLPAQQLKILQWLLEDENNRVEKSLLQETFWAESLTGYNSMTGSINRLRSYLNEVDCDYTVSTKKGSDWYELVLKEK